MYFNVIIDSFNNGFTGGVLKKHVLFILLLASIGLSFGQNVTNDSVYRFSGTVFHAHDSIALANVHVLNLSKGTGTITSEKGGFILSVRNADTIKFSSIGFADHYMIIRALLLRDTLMIYLRVDTVQMKEFTVYPFPPRRFFKLVFLETRVPNEKIPELCFPGFKNDPGRIPPTGISVMGPTQFLYNTFNKKARTRRKLIKNRKRYSKYIVPEVGDSLVFPEKLD